MSELEPVAPNEKTHEREKRHPTGREHPPGHGKEHEEGGFETLLRHAVGEAFLPAHRLKSNVPPPAPPLQGVEPESVWSRAGKRYNVHAMKFEQLAELALLLHREGAVSVLEYLLMASSPEDEKAAFGNVLFTGQDEQGNVDWITEFQARREAARYYNHLVSMSAMERVLEALERVAAARRGSVNAAA